MRILILGYPFLVHAAVLLESVWMMDIAVMIIVTSMLQTPLTARRIWAWLLMAAVIAVLAVLSLREATIYLLFVPPVLINLFLCHLFSSSLRPGRTALLSVIARKIRGELPVAIAAYTRRLTGVWAMLFALMAAWSVAFAVLADRETWSLVTNFLNYLVVGVFFCLEYLYRIWRHSDQNHPGLRGYIAGMARVDFRNLK